MTGQMPGPARGNTKPRVLVIDDAATMRGYCRQAMEAVGFEVAEAFNGIEGLEKLLADPFDVVIVDVNMPKMDGLSFVGKLRTIAPTAGLPVLMTSTLDRERGLAAARSAGANFYLVKPIDADDLRLFTGLMTGKAAP